ncbi:unnamed protein product, partial [Symbiodinium sp. CCMP2456]
VGIAGHSNCWVTLCAADTLRPALLDFLVELFFRLRKVLLGAQEHAGERDIIFEGIRLKPRRAVPSVILVSAVPLEGFASILRPLAVVAPDIHRIMEVGLLAGGFEDRVVTRTARRIASRLREVNFLKVCARGL